eukprot:TRINITY_DN51098_c0_g1_i1.p1 TRINITY_DN51098_c0_g1~~TRINITY_DN51098_c0_g1_i1.p1  ORF type:complete len:734 (+),score=73.95 TRINITY_DN51098_c0_g1_i1:131-2203(+)
MVSANALFIVMEFSLLCVTPCLLGHHVTRNLSGSPTVASVVMLLFREGAHPRSGSKGPEIGVDCLQAEFNDMRIRRMRNVLAVMLATFLFDGTFLVTHAASVEIGTAELVQGGLIIVFHGLFCTLMGCRHLMKAFKGVYAVCLVSLLIRELIYRQYIPGEGLMMIPQEVTLLLRVLVSMALLNSRVAFLFNVAYSGLMCAWFESYGVNFTSSGHCHSVDHLDIPRRWNIVFSVAKELAVCGCISWICYCVEQAAKSEVACEGAVSSRLEGKATRAECDALHTLHVAVSGTVLVRLDSELRLLDHSAGLALLLCRCNGRTHEDRDFADFFYSQVDFVSFQSYVQRRIISVLETKLPQPLLPFRVCLTDCTGGRLDGELFHASFVEDDQIIHLVTIRILQRANVRVPASATTIGDKYVNDNTSVADGNMVDASATLQIPSQAIGAEFVADNTSIADCSAVESLEHLADLSVVGSAVTSMAPSQGATVDCLYRLCTSGEFPYSVEADRRDERSFESVQTAQTSVVGVHGAVKTAVIPAALMLDMLCDIATAPLEQQNQPARQLPGLGVHHDRHRDDSNSVRGIPRQAPAVEGYYDRRRDDSISISSVSRPKSSSETSFSRTRRRRSRDGRTCSHDRNEFGRGQAWHNGAGQPPEGHIERGRSSTRNEAMTASMRTYLDSSSSGFVEVKQPITL